MFSKSYFAFGVTFKKWLSLFSEKSESEIKRESELLELLVDIIDQKSYLVQSRADGVQSKQTKSWLLLAWLLIILRYSQLYCGDAVLLSFLCFFLFFVNVSTRMRLQHPLQSIFLPYIFYRGFYLFPYLSRISFSYFFFSYEITLFYCSDSG